MNTVECVSLVHIPKNDKISYKETFKVYKNSELKNTLIYYHSYFNCNGKKDISLYSKSFCDQLNILSRFIPEGSTAIDVGAYDGDSTLLISYLCGKGGKVYAFECGEVFSSNLIINVESNLELDIEAIPAALMPESGIHEFLYCPTDYNGGYHSTNSWVGTYTVPRLIKGISFQDFSKNKDLSNLSFIKIDAEGHDFHILLSFKDYIKKIRPVIHCEWFPRTDAYIVELINFLDYKIFCGFTLAPVTIGFSEWRQDIILVPSEKINYYGL